MSTISNELPSVGEIVSFTTTVLNTISGRRDLLKAKGERLTNFGDVVSYGLQRGYGIETIGFTENDADPNHHSKVVALTTEDGTVTLNVRTRRFSSDEVVNDPIVFIEGTPVAIDRIIYQTSGFPAGIEGVHEISGDHVIVEDNQVTIGAYRVRRRPTHAFDHFKTVFDDAFSSKNQ